MSYQFNIIFNRLETGEDTRRSAFEISVSLCRPIPLETSFIRKSTTMRILAAFLCALFFALPVHASEKLRVRVTEFAPNYFMQGGHWSGLDVELAEALAREAGLTVEFLDLPWSRALDYIKKGKLDMMMNLSRTPDRETFMNFIGPERVSKRVLVVRKDNVGLKIATLDDLATVARQAKRQFGIQHEAKYSEAFDTRLASDAEFAKSFDKVTQGRLFAKKVVVGNNIGFFEDENFVIYQMKHSPEFQELALHSFVLASDPVYFGISKQLDATAQQSLEAAFRRVKNNGTLAKIRARWGKQ